MTRPKKEKAYVLLVDDDTTARGAIATYLTSVGYVVDQADDGLVALERLVERPADIVVTDLMMPRMDGLALLGQIREQYPHLPVIMATSSEELGSAVAAMRAGAEDYLTKPVDLDALEVTVERALERREVRVEAENLRRQIRERDSEGLRGLIGTSPAMQKVYRVARQVAPSRATVLITGESGTGKGELARAVHALSPRADKPFVALHCAALAESLLESELFGHEKGAFTGAERRRAGRFEQANGGTLFLDEIGEISPQTQVKLLRVLQERTFERVGGNESVSVDVRLVAATNRDLSVAVRDGKFREDLFYRLAVVRIDVPPLRDRPEDIAPLARFFARQEGQPDLPDDVVEDLGKRPLPGNVRELRNAVLAYVALGQMGLGSGPMRLPQAAGLDRALADAVRLDSPFLAQREAIADRFSELYVERLLRETNGNQTQAAKIAGLDRTYLGRLLAKLGKR